MHEFDRFLELEAFNAEQQTSERETMRQIQLAVIAEASDQNIDVNALYESIAPEGLVIRDAIGVFNKKLQQVDQDLDLIDPNDHDGYTDLLVAESGLIHLRSQAYAVECIAGAIDMPEGIELDLDYAQEFLVEELLKLHKGDTVTNLDDSEFEAWVAAGYRVVTGEYITDVRELLNQGNMHTILADESRATTARSVLRSARDYLGENFAVIQQEFVLPTHDNSTKFQKSIIEAVALKPARQWFGEAFEDQHMSNAYALAHAMGLSRDEVDRIRQRLTQLIENS